MKERKTYVSPKNVQINIRFSQSGGMRVANECILSQKNRLYFSSQPLWEKYTPLGNKRVRTHEKESRFPETSPFSNIFSQKYAFKQNPKLSFWKIYKFNVLLRIDFSKCD